MRVTYRVWKTEYDGEGCAVVQPGGASVRVDDASGERVMEFTVPGPQIAHDVREVLSAYLRDCSGDELGHLADALHTLARRRVVEEHTTEAER